MSLPHTFRIGRGGGAGGVDPGEAVFSSATAVTASWSVPDGVTLADMILVGGGQFGTAGSSKAGANRGGTGGRGGGTFVVNDVELSPGDTYTVTYANAATNGAAGVSGPAGAVTIYQSAAQTNTLATGTVLINQAGQGGTGGVATGESGGHGGSAYSPVSQAYGTSTTYSPGQGLNVEGSHTGTYGAGYGYGGEGGDGPQGGRPGGPAFVRILWGDDRNWTLGSTSTILQSDSLGNVTTY